MGGRGKSGGATFREARRIPRSLVTKLRHSYNKHGDGGVGLGWRMGCPPGTLLPPPAMIDRDWI